MISDEYLVSYVENETVAGLYLFRGSSNQTLIRQTKLSLTETNGKSLQNGPFSSDGPGNKLV